MEFDEFVAKIAQGQSISEEAQWLNAALAPQSDRLMINGKMAVDFIGRFENLQEDFNVVCDKIGKDRSVLPHVFQTKHAHYTQYYNDRAREIVGQIYQSDIKFFKYQFGDDS